MEKSRKIRKTRGSSSEHAREIRQAGHDDAKLFALELGLDEDYQNDQKAKKDVVDPSGDTHSVKSGKKKWQIFLYRESRFDEFRVMNGMGEILIDCINAFPQSYDEYLLDKDSAKQRLRPHMVALANKLQDKHRLKAFIEKSMFNGGEVDYLTVLHNGKYHVFHHKDVCRVMSEQLTVTNSEGKYKGQTPEQKVVLKYQGVNLGEVEMRNDSQTHYREIRFNMIKPKAMSLLFDNILTKENYSDSIIVYGEAIKRFGKWKPSGK